MARTSTRKACIFSYIGIKVIELSTEAKGNSELVDFVVELVLEPLDKISMRSFRIGLLISP